MKKDDRRNEDKEGKRDLNFEEKYIIKMLENFSRFQEVGPMGDEEIYLSVTDYFQKKEIIFPISSTILSVASDVILVYILHILKAKAINFSMHNILCFSLS